MSQDRSVRFSPAFSLATILLLLFSHLTYAKDTYVPAPLEPWKPWVLDENDQFSCPFVYNRAEYNCLWVSATDLIVSESGARFSIKAQAFAPRWMDLPGNDRYWPDGVVELRDGKESALPVRSFNGRAQVRLAAGNYIINGRIHWDGMPNNIPLPKNSGLIGLTLLGELITSAEVDRAGNLWLRKQATQVQQSARNSLSIQVFRLLKDENPAKLVTRVILEVSGEAREISTGQFLLEGFVPLEFSSALPARIDDDNKMLVQLKNGRWEIELTARYQGQLSQLSYQRLDESWPAYEIWSFEANRALRIVDVKGASPVDPSQTNLPNEWRHFPAYQVMPEQALTLDVLQRGDPTPEADKLIIDRDLFLDFDGGGYTAVDNITAQLGRSWRLDTQKAFKLGSVRLNSGSANEQATLITQSADGESEGFELRETDEKILAVSRIPRENSLPASGWRADIKQLQARLHLPPGWSLLSASGVDKTVASWVARWNLWDIFLVLIIVVASFRLFGAAASVLAAATLLFVYQRGGAPVFIWLNLVAVMALLTVTKGKAKRWLSAYHLVSFLLLIVILIPFSVDQLRSAVYPQLAESSFRLTPVGLSSNSPVEDSQMELAAEENDELDMVEEELVMQSKRGQISDAVRSMAPTSKPSKTQSTRYTNTNTDFDPQAIIQTGPGVPNWSWSIVRLQWMGPVSAEEVLRLYLVPPWLNRIANVFAVLLVLLFAGLLGLKSRDLIALRNNSDGVSGGKASMTGASALVLVAMLGGVTSDPVQASVTIDKDILRELQQRLTRNADCLPDCIAVQNATLVAKENSLAIELTIDAQDELAAPLPAFRNAWTPSSVSVDGRPGVLWFNDSGQLHVYLNKGRHRVEVRGFINKNDLELNFGVALHNLNSALEGWTVSGARDGYVQTGSLQLQRVERRDSAENLLLADPVPPFVSVARQLNLGLEWKVTTTVTRIAPTKGAISISVPLIDGEAPLSDFPREQDSLRVNFAANQNSVSWQSTIKVQNKLTLRAPDHHRWAEVWRLQVAPIWNLNFEGIAPIKQASSALHTPVWMPWPSESVSIDVARPSAVEGASLTIDMVNYEINMGQRSRDASLALDLRTSRGQSYSVALPSGAVLDALEINGVPQAMVKTTGDIDITLAPGSQRAALRWHQDAGVDIRSAMPRLMLGDNVSNITMSMRLPSDRWPLAVGGPLLGPAILFWGVLLVVIIGAFILSRSQLTPLKFYHWFLLGLGVCSTNLFSSLIIIAWLFCVGARGRYAKTIPDKYFKPLQVSVLIISLAALISLLAAISMGLLASPEMHVSGNGSWAYFYRWYQDRIEGLTPEAWVISVPILYYRIVMLAWALWLSVVLLNWLRWEWQQLQIGGFWERER